MKTPWWWPFGRVKGISASELAEALKSKERPQIVDVRTEGEFERSHIDGAVNVPVSRLRRALPALELDRGRPVVAVCLSGHRSIPAVRLLEAAGYEASQLDGGMRAWWRLRGR
jgi:rhodanese-related sulfurtransferase